MSAVRLALRGAAGGSSVRLMRNRLCAILTAALLLLGLVAAPVSAAPAAAGDQVAAIAPLYTPSIGMSYAMTQQQCLQATGKPMCFWWDRYGWGEFHMYYTTGIRGGHRLPSSMRGHVWSMMNRTDYRVYLFFSLYCGGSYNTIWPGSYWADATDPGYGDANRTRSFGSAANLDGGSC